MEKLETIKTKIRELEEEIKKKLDFHNEITNSLTKLTNEKELVRNTLHQLDGALAAYKQTVEFFESNPNANEQVVIEGEVV